MAKGKNPRKEKKKPKNKKDKTKTYTWKVVNPINNYGVNLNIGDYVTFSEKYPGEVLVRISAQCADMRKRNGGWPGIK